MSAGRSLTLEKVRAGYDQADVLLDVSLSAQAGRITCLLGANGAGKSTLIRVILGLTRPSAGRILFGEQDLTALPTHRVVACGVSCIPEGRKVFPRMSVAENLAVGAYLEPSASVIAERLDEVYRIFPRLRERNEQLAGTLSGGEQAMLSIGRGLMAKPAMLLIDEPSLGLSPRLVKENFAVIRDIHRLGIGVLLVEQNVRQTLAIADYGYVLAQGRVVAEGDAQQLVRNPEVRAAYFGSAGEGGTHGH